MSLQETIRAKLVVDLEPTRLDVINESELHAGHRSSPGTGNSHWRIVVVAEIFATMSRIERHRKINEILTKELSGEIHALAIHAFAPDEPVRDH